MKPSLYNRTLLAVGVATAMGVSSVSFAATDSGSVSNDAAAIENIATAVYSVGTGSDAVVQPQVESNKVIVSISETANFSLVAIDGVSATDDKNEDTAATPGGTTTFNHVLGNKGNVTDTYTITTTGNNDANIDTKAPNYTLDAATVINYTIQPIGGGALTQAQSAALTTLSQDPSGTINNGGTIQLPPGLEAVLNYDVTNPDVEGGQIGVGTLTATSSFITSAPSATEQQKTLVNENQTIVSLPVFKIEKSAACQGKADCNTLDLNAANTDIDYTINVTNVKTDYSADADNFVIRDVLPAGMTLSGTVTLPSGATAETAGTDADGRQIIDVTVPSLAVEGTLTLSFKVNIDKDVLRAAGSATNNATVYDSYDDTTPNPDDETTYDISDSTDDSVDNPNSPDDGPNTGGEDTKPTISFTDRNLNITAGTTEEAPVTGDVTFNHTVTNDGNENEGGTDRPIKFTLTDPATDAPLSVDNTTPYYSTDGGTTKLPLTDNGDGTYSLPDSVILIPNTAPADQAPTPGSSVEVGYTVKSNGTTDGVIGSAGNDIGKSETSTITMTPATVAGVDAPEKTAENTATIQGLKLEKLAAVVDANNNPNFTCPTGTEVQSLTYSDGSTAIDAKPFDCIVYKITATNTFTTKSLSAVTVSDEKAQWNQQATYQEDVKGLIDTSDTGVSDDGSGADIKSTFNVLQAEQTGTMTFSIKVNP